MSEPVHDRLEDDALLADVEALRESLPQVGVQYQEVALLDAPLEEGARPVGVRRQNELVEDGNPHIPRVRQSSFRNLEWTINFNRLMELFLCNHEVAMISVRGYTYTVHTRA